MKNSTLSIVISAFNEERNIEDCLLSVKEVADEIIFVDNTSTDGTVEKAKKFTKKIFSQKNDPLKIDEQKNLGFSKATCDWILTIDADERLTDELCNEIKSCIDNKDSVNGYWIPRKNIIFRKWIKSDMWWPDYQLKLFRRGKGKFDTETVHKALEVNGHTEKLENYMVHKNYDSVSQYIAKLNNYTDVEALTILNKGYELNFLDAVKFPVDDFVKTFFLERGYRDGLHGLVLSILQAFYMEVVFAKVWEAKGFKEVEGQDFVKDVNSEIKKSGSKIKYWIADASIRESNNPIRKTLLRAVRKIAAKKS